MKNIPIITFIIPLFIFSFIKLYSQEKPPSIEVYGTAIIKVVPDKMNWNINVQVEMDDVKEAKIQNDKSVSKVLNILEDEGIPSKEIQTGGIKIEKKYRPYSYEEKKYSVTNNIWFTVSNIEKYDLLTEKLIDIDNVYINNIILESTKEIETREQARIDALNAANIKAEKMASALGMSIDEPLLIQEVSGYYYSSFSNAISDIGTRGITDVESTFSAGTINVEARVIVTFKLLSKY
jgi:uncharacterized protein YggE